MVVFLSYLFAVILTVLLAIFLYPIAGFFWVMGLFGKISNGMLKFTRKTISKLWRDLKNTDIKNVDAFNKWECKCGCINNGKFCTECGAEMPKIEKNINQGD